MRWLSPGVELARDVAPADWVVTRLEPWDLDGARLASFAPAGFEAYARLFHPAGDRHRRPDPQAPDVGVRWGDLARSRGIALSPDVTFAEVSGIPPGDTPMLDDMAPTSGTLPPRTCRALVSVLRSHTGTAGLAWFCLWEGNGSFWSDRLLAGTPRVQAEHRSYFLFRGPLDAACAFEPADWYVSPNLWWPEDRAWIVVTEVDGYSTYVGGSEAAVADLLASPDLEAIRVSLDTHMDPEDRLPRWR